MHLNSPTPVLIFAIGNESRGDDALAPLLARKLHNYLNKNNISDKFELLEEFQLQIEHAMDMKDRQRVLFIDAGMDTPSPFAFYRIQASDEPVLYSHALKPSALLKVYEQFYNEAAPDSYILCIRGEQFKLGAALSLQAEVNLSRSLQFALSLLPDEEVWDSYASA